MCGRYVFYDERNQKLKEFIELANLKLPPETVSKVSLFDVVPSEKAFAGVCVNGQHVTRIMQWGFPLNRKLVINARCETVFQSPFFAGARPCVLPCTGYYEWSVKPRIKYLITTEYSPFYLAGICRIIDGGPHFVILTQDAVSSQKDIHPREPVIFDYDHARKWCASDDPASLLIYSEKKRILSPLK